MFTDDIMGINFQRILFFMLWSHYFKNKKAACTLVSKQILHIFPIEQTAFCSLTTKKSKRMCLSYQWHRFQNCQYSKSSQEHSDKWFFCRSNFWLDSINMAQLIRSSDRREKPNTNTDTQRKRLTKKYAKKMRKYKNTEHKKILQYVLIEFFNQPTQIWNVCHYKTRARYVNFVCRINGLMSHRRAQTQNHWK